MQTLSELLFIILYGHRNFKASFPCTPFIALPSSPCPLTKQEIHEKKIHQKKEDTQPSFEVKPFQLAFDRRTVKTCKMLVRQSLSVSEIEDG